MLVSSISLFLVFVFVLKSANKNFPSENWDKIDDYIHKIVIFIRLLV